MAFSPKVRTSYTTNKWRHPFVGDKYKRLSRVSVEVDD